MNTNTPKPHRVAFHHRRRIQQQQSNTTNEHVQPPKIKCQKHFAGVTTTTTIYTNDTKECQDWFECITTVVIPTLLDEGVVELEAQRDLDTLFHFCGTRQHTVNTPLGVIVHNAFYAMPRLTCTIANCSAAFAHELMCILHARGRAETIWCTGLFDCVGIARLIVRDAECMKHQHEKKTRRMKNLKRLCTTGGNNEQCSCAHCRDDPCTTLQYALERNALKVVHFLWPLYHMHLSTKIVFDHLWKAVEAVVIHGTLDEIRDVLCVTHGANENDTTTNVICAFDQSKQTTCRIIVPVSAVDCAVAHGTPSSLRLLANQQLCCVCDDIYADTGKNVMVHMIANACIRRNLDIAATIIDALHDAIQWDAVWWSDFFGQLYMHLVSMGFWQCALEEESSIKDHCVVVVKMLMTVNGLECQRALEFLSTTHTGLYTTPLCDIVSTWTDDAYAQFLGTLDKCCVVQDAGTINRILDLLLLPSHPYIQRVVDLFLCVARSTVNTPTFIHTFTSRFIVECIQCDEVQAAFACERGVVFLDAIMKTTTTTTTTLAWLVMLDACSVDEQHAIPLNPFCDALWNHFEFDARTFNSSTGVYTKDALEFVVTTTLRCNTKETHRHHIIRQLDRFLKFGERRSASQQFATELFFEMHIVASTRMRKKLAILLHDEINTICECNGVSHCETQKKINTANCQM